MHGDFNSLKRYQNIKRYSMAQISISVNDDKKGLFEADE